MPGKGSTATTTCWHVEMSGLCLSGGLKEVALFSVTGVGALAYAPLCTPGLGWPCAQSRDLSLQGSRLPAVPALKTRGPLQK